jgi:hypothetical protein
VKIETVLRQISYITLLATTLPPSAIAAAPQTVSGAVRDLGAQRYAADGGVPGDPIAGATVIIGNVLVLGVTVPSAIPRGDIAATTGADGTYTVSGYDRRGTTYVMVFPPAADGHLSLHGRADITDGKMRPLYLYQPSAVEQAELSRINSDREETIARLLIPDEIAFETARAHADFMATNAYYQHCIPAASCFVVPTFATSSPAQFAPRYSSPNDLYTALGGALDVAAHANWSENFYVAWPASNVSTASWQAADAWFMAEKCNLDKSCPNGPIVGGITSHYENIVNQRHIWVGLGDNAAGRPSTIDGAYSVRIPAFADFIQEFYSNPNR